MRPAFLDYQGPPWWPIAAFILGVVLVGFSVASLYALLTHRGWDKVDRQLFGIALFSLPTGALFCLLAYGSL